MPYIPYVSVDDFREYSGGIIIPASLDDVQLNKMLIAASVKVDGYCQTSFQYQRITNEMHNFIDREEGFASGWDVFPYYRPIRTVQQFMIATAQGQDAGWVGANTNVTPTYPASDNLPVGFGTLVVDRNRGFIQNTNSMLNFGIGVFRIFPQSLQPVTVMLSYTSGYDNGTEDDNAILPVPDPLREGTRVVATFMLMEHKLNMQDMGGLQSARVGDIHVTRFRPVSKTRQLSYQSVPDEAKDILLPLKLKSARIVGG